MSKMTLGKKLDRMIADLSRLASTANRGRDFKVAILAQEAISVIGRLRARGVDESSDHEWSDWIAWPPQIYPHGDDCHGLVDITDLERLARAKSEGPTV